MAADSATLAARTSARSPAAFAWISVTLLFFMLGVMTTLKDVLVAHLKATFALNYAQAMEIPFFFFASCFVLSIPYGHLMDRIGYRRAMVIGIGVTAAGALLLLPAASVPSFPLFLFSLVIQGIGLTFLQVSTNPFVTSLGSDSTAASRLNLIQGFNAGGMALGPKIGGLFILSAAPLAAGALGRFTPSALHAYQLAEASRVKPTYLVCSGILLLLLIAIAAMRIPSRAAAPHEPPATFAQLWRHRGLALAAIGIFVYVGAEVSVGSYLVSYLSQPEIGGISPKSAAGFVALYWGGAMVGRFLGSAVQQRVAPRKVLAGNAIAAAALVVLSMLTFGRVAMWTMIAVGLANSIMFPTIFTLGVEGLGRLKAHASGVLAAACAGGAVIPELQGLLADRVGIHHAFLLPILCYLYILWFAAKGSRSSEPT